MADVKPDVKPEDQHITIKIKGAQVCGYQYWGIVAR